MKKFRLIALLLALLLLQGTVGCKREENNLLCVTVLDVGQSECVLLTLGDKAMLIDAGSCVWQDELVGELALRGVKKLDALFITHPHEDHYGNARLLLETHTVEALILPTMESEEPGYRILEDTAARLAVSVRQMMDGDRFTFGDALCEVFCALPEDTEGNNASNVLRVSFGDCVLLFMGDAEEQAENALLARDIIWRCDLLKVGHHGSKTASSSRFLQACAPKIAAISCGKDNDYGFPHSEVLEGLAAVGAAVYRTDLSGSLAFACDGKSVYYME